MIRTISFTTRDEQLDRQTIDPHAIPAALADPNTFVWVDLAAPTPAETKSILEETFHFHPLSIEDCVAVSALPKVEEYQPGPGDKFSPYLFLILHAVDYNRHDGIFATSDLDSFLGRNFLVTYHDLPLRTIDAITGRCEHGPKNLARSPARLIHALLDQLVQNYQPALDELSTEIADLEQQAIQHPRPKTLNKLIGTKREVLHLRQIIGPQRDVMARLANGEFDLIAPQLLPYYRDVYDHLFRISQLAQTYTDSLTGILQVYLSMTSNQTGDVVKFLTLITAVTTPLMMIGTWYGMNFKDMPELNWRHGYLIAAATMILSTIGTYWYFRKKKWF